NLSRKGIAYIDKDVVFGIRPEDVADVLTLSEVNPAQIIEAVVEVSEPMGSETYLYLDTGTHAFIARVRGSDRFEINDRIKLSFLLDRAHLFDPATERVIK